MSFNVDEVRRQFNAIDEQARRDVNRGNPYSSPASEPMPYRYVREVWSDFIIVENEGSASGGSTLSKIPYSVDTEGKVQFGKPSPVRVEYVPLSAPTSERLWIDPVQKVRQVAERAKREEKILSLAGTERVSGYNRRSSTGKTVHVDAYTRSPGKMTNGEIRDEISSLSGMSGGKRLREGGLTAAQADNRYKALLSEQRSRISAGTWYTKKKGSLSVNADFKPGGEGGSAKDKKPAANFDYDALVSRNWSHAGAQWEKDIASGKDMDPDLRAAIQRRLKKGSSLSGETKVTDLKPGMWVQHDDGMPSKVGSVKESGNSVHAKFVGGGSFSPNKNETVKVIPTPDFGGLTEAEFIEMETIKGAHRAAYAGENERARLRTLQAKFKSGGSSSEKKATKGAVSKDYSADLPRKKADYDPKFLRIYNELRSSGLDHEKAFRDAVKVHTTPDPTKKHHEAFLKDTALPRAGEFSNTSTKTLLEMNKQYLKEYRANPTAANLRAVTRSSRELSRRGA
jgi:hypothetical protein